MCRAALRLLVESAVSGYSPNCTAAPVAPTAPPIALQASPPATCLRAAASRRSTGTNSSTAAGLWATACSQVSGLRWSLSVARFISAVQSQLVLARLPSARIELCCACWALHRSLKSLRCWRRGDVLEPAVYDTVYRCRRGTCPTPSSRPSPTPAPVQTAACTCAPPLNRCCCCCRCWSGHGRSKTCSKTSNRSLGEAAPWRGVAAPPVAPLLSPPRVCTFACAFLLRCCPAAGHLPNPPHATQQRAVGRRSWLSLCPSFSGRLACSVAASASAHLLTSALPEEQLGCLCDVKEAGGQRYFRLNDELVSGIMGLRVGALLRNTSLPEQAQLCGSPGCVGWAARSRSVSWVCLEPVQQSSACPAGAAASPFSGHLPASLTGRSRAWHGELAGPPAVHCAPHPVVLWVATLPEQQTLRQLGCSLLLLPQAMAWLVLKAQQAKAALLASPTAAFRWAAPARSADGACTGAVRRVLAAFSAPRACTEGLAGPTRLHAVLCLAAAWMTWRSQHTRRACWESTSRSTGRTGLQR